jgi:HSP90 family molecular chaperone
MLYLCRLGKPDRWPYKAPTSLISLIINTFCSNKRFFLHGPVSNASYAFDKIHYEPIRDPAEQLNKNKPLQLRNSENVTKEECASFYKPLFND